MIIVCDTPENLCGFVVPSAHRFVADTHSLNTAVSVRPAAMYKRLNVERLRKSKRHDNSGRNENGRVHQLFIYYYYSTSNRVIW